jgi:hypothetical protein
MPAKMAARTTLIKVKKADAAANLDKVLNVRGREQAHDTTAMMALSPTVQTVVPPWPIIVLRYL